jgi:hypothetical protein
MRLMLSLRDAKRLDGQTASGARAAKAASAGTCVRHHLITNAYTTWSFGTMAHGQRLEEAPT